MKIPMTPWHIGRPERKFTISGAEVREATGSTARRPLNRAVRNAGPMGDNDIHRARGMLEYNPYAIHIADEIIDNVWGPKGIQLNLGTTRRDRGNLAPIQTVWAAERDMLDASGQRNWAEMGDYIIREMFGPGELFAIWQTVDRAPRLHFMPRESLRRDYGRETAIERDKYGRPTVYHFPSLEEPVDADDVIHFYRQDRSFKGRGISWIRGALDQLQDLDNYTQAYVSLANLQAMRPGAVVLEGTLYDLVMGIDTRAGQTIEKEDLVKEVDIDPGTSPLARAGTSWVEYTVGTSLDANIFMNIRRALVSEIAIATGLSYATVASDMASINYSAGKIQQQREQMLFDKLRGMMREYVMAIYRGWLERSRRSEPSNVRYEWVERGYASIDPIREANTNKTNVETGIHSRRELVEASGRDYQQLQDQRREEAEFEAELDRIRSGGESEPTDSDNIPATDTQTANLDAIWNR